MKKFILSALLILSLVSATGCGSGGIVPPINPSDPNYPLAIEQSKADIKNYSTVVTGLYILSQKGDTRTKAAIRANHFAKTMATLASQDFTIDQLAAEAAKALLGSNSEDEKLVAALVTSLSSSIRDKIHIKFDLPESEKLRVTKLLVTEAATTVESLTEPYTHSVPTTRP